jgi:hypothetical protein
LGENLQLSEGMVRIPMTVFTRQMFVPVPSQDLDFQRHNSWSRVCLIACGER